MLEGRIAFVTGGTGAVGAAIVRTLVRYRAKVGFCYRTQEAAARSLEAEIGPSVRGWQLDITHGDAVTQVAERVEQELGPVEILVNNAGVAQVMPFALTEEIDWDHVMDVNVKGPFLVTKAFARPMIRRQRGSIVNLGSLAGARVLEVPVHYATAKSAMIGFTLSLAREFARYGIRVNAVVPGLLTDGVSTNVPERQKADYEQHCTLRRSGRPEEVAELVAFLASDRSSYINAQAIHVDGGV